MFSFPLYFPRCFKIIPFQDVRYFINPFLYLQSPLFCHFLPYFAVRHAPLPFLSRLRDGTDVRVLYILILIYTHIVFTQKVILKVIF